MFEGWENTIALAQIVADVVLCGFIIAFLRRP